MTNMRPNEAGEGAMSELMQVVYERKDSYDLQTGPFGYTKVGFRYRDEITWMDVCGSHFDNTKFAEREQFVKELVRRWNTKTEG